MSTTAADQFRPVNSREPCAICDHGDWCRSSDSGAVECHRSSESFVRGYRRVATTQAGFGVYRLSSDVPKQPPPPHKRSNSKNGDEKPLKTYPTAQAAAESFAKHRGATIAASWQWSPTWNRFRLQIGVEKTFVEVTQQPGGWACKGPEKPHCLYQINDLPTDGLVYVVEGEKCADAVRSIDLFGTTSGSCTSAAGADWTPISGRNVVILNDADEAGRKYAASVASILCGLGCTVRTVELYPNANDGSDIADWVEARDSRDTEEIRNELAALVEQAEPQDCSPLIIRTANEYEVKAVEWLWPSRIPIGKLTVIAGDPKVGKSFLSVYLVAVVSAGHRWAGPEMAHCTPGEVVMLSAEDDPEDTIVPRLLAAGAELTRVHIIEGVREPGQKDGEPFRLDIHLRHLERLLDERPKIRLVIIDPISAFLGEADSHNNAEVRALLMPLAKLAAARGVAVVAISHLNKSAGIGTKALYRTQGSLAFTAAARAVWYVVIDGENKDRRLFLPAGLNLAECPGGLAYSIRPGVNGGPCLAWETERVNLDADEGMAAEEGRKPETGTEKATTWLRSRLAEGPMLSKELEAEARARGFTTQQVRGAREKLGVQVTQVREGSKLTGWQVSMPQVSE